MQNIESVIMVSFSVIYLHTGYLYLSFVMFESVIWVYFSVIYIHSLCYKLSIFAE